MHSISGKKICIVTDELAGPDYNGGIGTACHGLALALAAAGFSVDVLYTRVADGVVNCSRGSFEEHVAQFARRGVRLLSISQDGPWYDFPAKSFNVMNHLQSEFYNFVFFNDTHGTGYYPLLSRRTGNPRFAATKMCVVTHSATQWILDLNGEPLTGVHAIRLLEMERRSIELSDVVFSPSAYMIEKYKGYGWRFPAEAHVRRLILPASLRATDTSEPKRHAVDEIVFFGRLERRKGIEYFCAALDRLKYDLQGKTVSFLGKDTVVNGVSALERVVARSAGWPFEVRVMQDFNREAALNYLRGGRRLAVMPSLEDNSPCVIQECLELGIPFIASSGSGGEELIAPGSRADCCFAPTVGALSEKIAHILKVGASTGQLSFDPAGNEREMVEWLRNYLAGPTDSRERQRPARQAADDIGGSMTLLVVGPAALERSGAAHQFDSMASAFGHSSQVAVLPGFGVAASQLATSAMQVLTPADYDTFASRIAQGDEDFVCVWDADLEMNPEWILRARNCLSRDLECIAVSGLATAGMAPKRDHGASYMSLSSISPTLRKPIVGAGETLALLAQDSNSGYVLLRGTALRAMRDCPPWDETYARLKPVEDWIDEILARLRRQGGKIMLVPDLPATHRGENAHFEVFRRSAMRRDILASLAAQPPGSAGALVYGLGIDKVSDIEARQGTLEFLEGLAAQTKVQASDWTSGGGNSNEYLDKVVVAAFATGQIDLAKGVLAYLASLKGGRHYKYASEADHFWDGLSDEISLAVLWEQGRCVYLDQNRAPEIAVEGGEKAFLLQAKRPEDGVGRLTFEVDLTDIDRFSSSVRTLGAEGIQVRFYVAVSSKDGANRLRRELVTTGSAPLRFDFAVPMELRQHCSVILVVELLSDGLATDDANAYWANPCFVRHSPRQEPGPRL